MMADKVQVKKVNPTRFHFLLLFLFGVFTAPISVFSSDSKTELYRYNKLTLQNHPVRNPRSLPVEFVPEGAALIHSTELKSERGYFDTKESFLLFTHAFKKKQMEVYYASIFKSLHWKILQEEITDQKTVIMAESQNKKVVTIQIEAVDAGSRIKLFYKKSGG
ncbi:hypothetical protein JWG44_01190 [Leptospira sp. 201903071]|uniref:hypothetical protein n=1 Tax=Leptospira ainazelensis TaxID=2810034 RepID=UPI001964CC60|nr:hypothetical protein [Leptospira ainazelensis]